MIEVENEVNTKTNKRTQYLIDRDNLIKLAKSHKIGWSMLIKKKLMKK